VQPREGERERWSTLGRGRTLKYLHIRNTSFACSDVPGTTDEYLVSSHRRSQINAEWIQVHAQADFPKEWAFIWAWLNHAAFLLQNGGRSNWQSFRKCQHWCFFGRDWFWNYTALGSLKAGLEMQGFSDCSNEISIPMVPVREARLQEWHGKRRERPNNSLPRSLTLHHTLHQSQLREWNTKPQFQESCCNFAYSFRCSFSLFLCVAVELQAKESVAH